MSEFRICRISGKSFTINDRDLEFYRKIDVPSPLLCPDCRLQRRLAWRIERTLYLRNCDLTGKRILSIFSPASPYRVFSPEAWYSDRWNALDYGRDFDFNRPLFQQFSELMREVPLLSASVMNLQNCDYVNQCGWSKNCYFTIEADQNEDSMYSYRVFFVKTCVDCTEVFRSERCYECIDCENCFRLIYSQLCRQCSDSAFLFDCRGCSNCFGCVGLRQKSFCWFNEQVTKEEYTRRLQAFDLQNPEYFKTAQNRFETLKLKFPRKAFIGEMNENVSGNYIYESKDCADCYNIRNCRDCSYCNMVRNSKDCMDYFVWGDNAERVYEAEACGHNILNLRFCVDCYNGVRDLTYCFLCALGTADCFGCIGVQKGKYCILNKPYSKEDYEKLIPRIIEYIKKTGEWGEFFSMNISPYAYNETVAQEYFPLTKEQAIQENLLWRENLPFSTGKETIHRDKIPSEIDKVPDSIVNEILACEATGRNYRITTQELNFYRAMQLPIPRLHPDERHRRRMLLRNPRKLWDRNCEKCGAAIKTTYAPERTEIVYCEACYLKTVY